MFAEGNIEITNLVFNPEDSIHFDMDPRMQTTVVEVTNNENFDVFFRWKSNRPPVYRFQPSSCIVRANTSQRFVMQCEGMEREYSKPRDRFSATISRINHTNLEAREIWRNKRLRRELFQGKLHKKMIFVIFNGLNCEEWWNRDRNGNLEQRQPTFGLAEVEETSAIEDAIRNGRFVHVIVPLEPENDEEGGSSDGGSGGSESS